MLLCKPKPAEHYLLMEIIVVLYRMVEKTCERRELKESRIQEWRAKFCAGELCLETKDTTIALLRNNGSCSSHHSTCGSCPDAAAPPAVTAGLWLHPILALKSGGPAGHLSIHQNGRNLPSIVTRMDG